MQKKFLLLYALLLVGLSNNILHANTADSFQFPLASYSTNTNCNGFWSDCFRTSKRHLGEDAIATVGTAVYAPANGTVKDSRYSSGYGGLIIIEHTLSDGTKVTSLVAHMFTNETEYGGVTYDGLQFSKNDVVSKGDFLGYIADSANNGGWVPHIHFGIRKGGFSSFNHEDNCKWSYAGYTEKGTTCAHIENDWYVPTNFVNANSSSGSYSPPSSNGGNNPPPADDDNPPPPPPQPTIAFDFSDKKVKNEDGDTTSTIYDDEDEMGFKANVKNDGTYTFSGNGYMCSFISGGDNIDATPELGDCEQVSGSDLEPGEDDDITVEFDVPDDTGDYNVIGCMFESEATNDGDYFSTLGCSSEREFIVVKSNQTPIGELSLGSTKDSCEAISGYIKDPDSSAAINGILTSTSGLNISFTANQEHSIGDGNHGFSVALPVSVYDGITHTYAVKAYDHNTGALLPVPNADLTLTCPKSHCPGLSNLQCNAAIAIILD